jgi:hypothetical protein
MARRLPRATARLKTEQAGLETGEDLLTILAPVAQNADFTPRLFTSTTAILDRHGYNQGAELAAIMWGAGGPGLPLQFTGLPIITPGIVGRIDQSGNSGTSVVGVAVGPSGSLEETNGAVRIVAGGTMGVDTIRIAVSLDEGENEKQVRLGTATSYTIENVGLVLSFDPGTLVTGETVLRWHSTAPKTDGASITAAKNALAEDLRTQRTWLLIGDVEDANELDELSLAVNDYETSVERYVLAKASLAERLPLAKMSKTRVWMTGAPSITFTQGAGPPNDTIARDAGSFDDDGFSGWTTVADWITIAGASEAGNNITAQLESAVALTLTLEAGGILTTGTDVEGVSIWAAPGLLFVDGGGSEDTLIKGKGSWLDDGFKPGEPFSIAGTVSNDGTYAPTAVTATTITVPTGSFADEEISSWDVDIVGAITDSLHLAAADEEYASVVNKRLDLGYGRLRRLSPITGGRMRRPVQWADVWVGFNIDLSQTTWLKERGALADWSLLDQFQVKVEHDDRSDNGPATVAGFTSARTWANGPRGAFITSSLTRADEPEYEYTHDAYVAYLMQTVVQRSSEGSVGDVLVLQPADESGARVATPDSLADIRNKVQGPIDQNLLGGDGGVVRASGATWEPSPDDDLRPAGPRKLTGNGQLNLNGTLIEIDTSRSAGPTSPPAS